jgi:hydrogenase-4 transcriptional activator
VLQFRQFMLAVWREACRHIEIQDFASSIMEQLAEQLPLNQLVVRRFHRESSDLVTVAVASESSGPAEAASAAWSEQRRHFPAEDWTRVIGWCGTGRVLRRGVRRTGMVSLVLPPEITADVLVAPLVTTSAPEGILVLVAHPDRTFDEPHLEWIEALREPFTAALENDRRVHELATLRAAAEADRGALLRRLGRNDLGDTIVGEQTGLRQVMERVALVTHSDLPVLILGETGTGKELVARALHVRSARHEGPFIRVNCGAIPPDLIDSQLFGHEKGSFTGADQARAGWFERADGGTLFLDEIGELPLEAQVRFLRVLQDGFVERVGGNRPVHVDVRVVAATHRDLAQMVREGRFREDLWYRLAVFPILIPPLRERKPDIAPLATHFAERAAIRFGLPVTTPTADDIRLLQTYDWPGNIRELGAVMDRAVILGGGQRLEVVKALGWLDTTSGSPLIAPNKGPAEHAVVSSPTPPATQQGGQPSNKLEILSLDAAMRAHIEMVLERTEGRIEGRRGAAALLKINPHTLRARMRKLGIHWQSFRPRDETT